MRTSDFHYDLPLQFIAQTPAEPRDHSRLMVLDRYSGEWQHRRFFEIGEFLRPGDLLVFNQSKVFRARLLIEVFGKKLELFFLRCRVSDPSNSIWEILARPGKRLSVGQSIELSTDLRLTILSKEESGVFTVQVNCSSDQVLDFLETHGEVPLPPYIEKTDSGSAAYQTVYAKDVGSVAAPTAGFHFTDRLLEELKGKGIQTAFVTLHVGIGTFVPVKTQTLEEHVMHSEYVSLSKETVEAIQKTKGEGQRVIAVGTTTVRVLEGVTLTMGTLQPYEGDINIFIKPGFQFQVIDGLITNFHLPKSTLLALVSAFAGREQILAAYEEAKREGYRFFSFGDGMFVM